MSATHEIAAAVGAAADRLRSLPESRLRRVAEPTRAVLDRLAALAAGIEARTEPEAPPPPLVPALNLFALGDQLAVLGTDLVAVADPLEPDEAVWLAEERKSLRAALQAAQDCLRDLRAVL
ncbi:MAG: hypothetical protein ACT4P1_14315 [Sporichthyaceae bacterium]